VRFVPDDAAVVDGALLAGRSVVEHAPDSPVRQAVADLASALLPWTVSTTVRRERKRRGRRRGSAGRSSRALGA
jgi:MinD-like ATPase involved in chromosome partitioning or flagellar assembly